MRAGVTKKKKLTESETIREILCQTTRLYPNDRCADCGALCPNWVSLAFGIFVCDACSGVHRSFGTHITRIKSITADSFKQEELRGILDVGNSNSNELYLASLNGAIPTLISAEDKAAHIKAKYIDKKFARRDQQPMAAPSQMQHQYQQNMQPQSYGQMNMYPKQSFAGSNTDQALTNSLFGNVGAAPSSNPNDFFNAPGGYSSPAMFPGQGPTGQPGSMGSAQFSSFAQPMQQQQQQQQQHHSGNSHAFGVAPLQQGSSYASTIPGAMASSNDMQFGVQSSQQFSQPAPSSFGASTQSSFGSSNASQFSQPSGGYPPAVGTQQTSFSASTTSASFGDTSSSFFGGNSSAPQSGGMQYSQFSSQPTQSFSMGATGMPSQASAGMPQSFTSSISGNQSAFQPTSGFGTQMNPGQQQAGAGGFGNNQYQWQSQQPPSNGGFGYSGQSAPGANPFM